MRLSEAIRLGTTMKPQSFSQHDLDGSCALASAAEAIGLRRHLLGNQWLIDYSGLREAFPDNVNLQLVPCPICARVFADYGTPFAVVWHLNDQHRWTREQIADFVELHETLPENPPPSVLAKIEEDRRCEERLVELRAYWLDRSELVR